LGSIADCIGVNEDSRPPEKKQLISLAEAAELYGFSHNYLRNIARRGRLKARKIAGAWLTTPEDIEEFIRSRKERGVYRDDIQLD
jgi:hypothetical protein